MPDSPSTSASAKAPSSGASTTFVSSACWGSGGRSSQPLDLRRATGRSDTTGSSTLSAPSPAIAPATSTPKSGKVAQLRRQEVVAMVSRYDADVDKSFIRTFNRCRLLRAEGRAAQRNSASWTPRTLVLAVLGLGAWIISTPAGQTVLDLITRK